MTDEVRNFQGTVIFTRDTHGENYMNTQEGKRLPVPHCIRGTKGWEICPPLEKLRLSGSCLTFDKPSFGSMELAGYMEKLNQETPVDEIQLIGLCTDICVISNALLLKAALPEVKISVKTSCCAGVSPESHKAALTAMASCQVEVI